MRISRKYLTQFALSFLGSFALAKQYEILPQSVLQQKYYSYTNNKDFLISFLGVWTIIGFILFLTNRSDNMKVQLMCPSCEHTEEFNQKDTDDKICSKCIIKMVPLEGFYLGMTEELDMDNYDKKIL